MTLKQSQGDNESYFENPGKEFVTFFTLKLNIYNTKNTNKGKIRQLDFIKIVTYCALKDTYYQIQSKKATYRMEENICKLHT